MSKKKQKTRLEKEVKKHDFSHLTRTKTAAKIVEAEIETDKEARSPQDKEIGRDLRTGIIIISVFVVVIVALWWFLGRNGELLKFTDSIKLN